MSNNRIFAALLLLVVMSASVYAQKSAYGRFGYGELSPPAFSAGGAMGGIGYGVRDSKLLNPLNPASYSSADSLSFLFDVGVSADIAWYQDNNIKDKTFEGNIDHAGMQFRLVKGLGVSLGMAPFSSVNYSFGSSGKDAAGISRTDKYTGEGGFTRIYLGVGYSPFKNFSIGANASYFFGRTIYTTKTIFSSTEIKDNAHSQTLKINHVLADFGLQYALPLGKDKLTLGLVYTPKLPLNGKYRYIEEVGTDTGTAIKEDTTVSSMGFDYPQTFGGGLTYTGSNKYMVGADVEYQQWSNARFFAGGEDSWDTADAVLRDKIRIAVGGQYTPNATGRNYFGKVRYRIGGHYSNSYFQIPDSNSNGALTGSKEYGVSAGFGLPLIDNRSVINLSFDYTAVVPERPGFIDERYFKITVSYTMNEIWFRKIRLE